MRIILFIPLICLLVACSSKKADSSENEAVQAGDPAAGETIFRQGVNDAPPCIACHALQEGNFSLGPVMAGISQRAGEREDGLDAEAYIHQSILEPSAFVVPGYRDIMLPDYASKLSDQNLADLTAFLLQQ